ncbi:hypothetical protein [Roseovarius sp. D0-M9]|uniref:hypothetical protein n=1 Tax=Roseovarius sp. D0-M9 TaxID=3127117 RepID=UPI00300FCF5F
MKHLWTTALCTGLALAFTGPLAAMDKTVSAVEVKADMSAYEDSNVLKYWPTLETDLAASIASKVTVDDNADAPRLTVEINKVAIDGDTFLPDSGEFNQIEGTVVMHQGDNAVNSSSTTDTQEEQTGGYPLNMTAISGSGDAPEGWIVVEPSQDDFYDALINAYADTVVERIEQ